MFGHPDRGALRRSAWRALAGAAAAALALGFATAVAAPAQAASPGVELSSDGVHYGTALAGGSLFGSPLLVPQTGVDGSFWVRNSATTAGFLRVSLATVSAPDSTLASAMSVRAATPGWPGTPVSLAAADPCYVLTQGQVLGAGATVKVDARLALADLTGTDGQDVSSVFSIVVALSDVGTGTIPPTECPSAGPGPANPPATGTGPGSPNGGTGVTRTITFPGTGFVVDEAPGVGTGSQPTVEQPTVEPPVGPGIGPAVAALVANTAVLLQELDVIWWIAAAAIGVLLLFWRRGRRRDDDSDTIAPSTPSATSALPAREDVA